MSRRLELPDEFVFNDGVRVRTPGELADLLEKEPDRGAEVWRRVEEGDLERWLLYGGWEALAQRVAELRQRGGEMVQLVRALRGASTSVARRTAAERVEVRLPEAPQSAPPGEASRAASRRESMAPVHAGTESQEQAAESELPERQRQAVRAFGQAEAGREQEERAAAEQARAEAAVAAERAGEARAEGERFWGEIQGAQ